MRSLLIILLTHYACTSTKPRKLEIEIESRLPDKLHQAQIFSKREIKNENGEVKTHYFRRTPIWRNDSKATLPSQTIFAVEELDENLKILKKNHILTWDMNQDGHVDMLEVRDSDGAALAQYFDFNFDGIVDEKRFAN